MSVQYQQETDEAVEYSEPSAPLPIYTIVLIVGIGCVFVAQLATGLRISADIAGFDKPAFRSGQYWRILTGAALHGSPLHVLMNCYAFYSFGRITEMLSNRAHLAIVFLLAAIGGGVLSLIVMPDGLSVGASGGIVGVVGYLAVYAFRRRQFVSAEFRKSLLINIGIVLAFGLFLMGSVDNAAHIGGLLTGAVYAFIQIPTDEYVDPRSASSVVSVAGLISLGVYLATCAFSILVLLRLV
ncbi:MAG TPA: rhomboid family intramembrane serine protease [Pyrinomonadaceae bacterium]|nr:rhomboid family intramembrane serine protease [Pyrinomonadaceae bacterium]